MSIGLETGADIWFSTGGARRWSQIIINYSTKSEKKRVGVHITGIRSGFTQEVPEWGPRFSSII